MATINHKATLDIAARVAAGWSSAVRAVTGGTDQMRKSVRKLKTQQREVGAEMRTAQRAAEAMGLRGSSAVSDLTGKHSALLLRQKAVNAELNKAHRAAAKLGEEGSDEIDRLTRAARKLEAEERDVAEQLEHARREAQRLGVEGSADVARLRAEHERLGRTIDSGNRKLARRKAWQDLAIGSRVSSALRQTGENFAWLGRKAMYAGTAVGAVGTALAIGFAKSGLETASKFETLSTVLNGLEGSAGKAKAALAWVKDFADKTPYTLDQVSESFVRLRAYGLEARSGLLRTLGDTAAAMGKPLMQAVEAIADAVTGENERLKEFGIKAAKSGGQIAYEYTDAAGKQQVKRVRANSRAMIQQTLTAIWNEKYGGQMAKLSKTWAGLTSTLSSKWDDFKLRVFTGGANGGLFGRLKKDLDTFMLRVDRWANDGTLDRWADQIREAYTRVYEGAQQAFKYVRSNWDSGDNIKDKLQGLWEVSKDVARAFVDVAKIAMRVGRQLSSMVGGAENLTKILLGLGAAKTLAPMFSLLGVARDVAKHLWSARSAAKALQGAEGLGGLGAGGKGGLGRAAGRAGVWGALAAGSAAAGYYGAKAIDSTKSGSSAMDAINKSSLFQALQMAVGEAFGIDSMVDSAKSWRAVRDRELVQQSLRIDSFTVSSPNANATEVADEVMRKLKQQFTAAQAGAYGG